MEMYLLRKTTICEAHFGLLDGHVKYRMQNMTLLIRVKGSFCNTNLLMST